MQDFTPANRDVRCPPPDRQPRPPRSFDPPAGAVDAHAHVIDIPPYHENRGYTPDPHDLSEYLGVLDAVGLARGVLVQPTVHGTDNGCMRRALRAAPQRLRGIAVVDPSIDDAELGALVADGVVGLRLVLAASGGAGLGALARYRSICTEMGWHLQVMLRADEAASIAPSLIRGGTPLVIDHMGYFAAAQGAGGAGMAVLRSLLADGAWVKLSGAFRTGTEPAYEDAVEIGRELIATAPDRCVWGSDWPHVNFHGAMPNVGDLLDLLAFSAPDETRLRSILVDNAVRLYGFGKSNTRDRDDPDSAITMAGQLDMYVQQSNTEPSNPRHQAFLP